MRGSTLRLVLVLSLLLNISVLASAGYVHFKQSRYRAVSPFSLAVQRPGDPAQSCLFEELSLKPEQQRKMQQKAFAFHTDMERRRQGIEERRMHLVALMRVENPDSKAIDDTVAQINRLQEGIQKTVVAHLLEFKGMLDREQQKKFLDLIAGAMVTRAGAGCP